MKNVSIKKETWPKYCGRCNHHISEEGWENLVYVGVQKSYSSDCPDLEIRNCNRCLFPIAIAVPDDFV